MMNDYKNQTKFDINDIIKILPHRYPFILIDRVEIIEQGESLIALKNLTINEPLFSNFIFKSSRLKQTLEGFYIMNTQDNTSNKKI